MVEDDPYFTRMLDQKLAPYGRVISADSFHQFEKRYNHDDLRSLDFIFVDLELGSDFGGHEILRRIKSYEMNKIVVSSHTSPDLIRLSYDLGAHHFFSKRECLRSIEQLIQRSLREERSDGKKDKIKEFVTKIFLTTDKKIINQLYELWRYGHDIQSVFIAGETGVGKGEVAKFVHDLLRGEEAPFQSINVSTLPEGLIESELFGHEKGAFTGATAVRTGVLKNASGGSIFLDEVASMPLAIQPKFLKVLEEKKFRPLGGTKTLEVDFTLISATCEDIAQKIKERSFRLDLFYRINESVFFIPPLRERKDDVFLLFNFFIEKYPRKVFIDEDAYQPLMDYEWPGNVRELKHLVSSLMHKELGIITKEIILKLIEKNRRFLTGEVFLG